VQQERTNRTWVRRLIRGTVSVALIGAVFFYALPRFADFSSVGRAIGQMTWIELATLAALALWNQVTYWFVMISALPGSNIWQAMKINEASTAVSNTLPGGSAIGTAVTYSMYSAYGFARADIALALLTAGLWNNFVKLAMPVIAVIMLVVVGEPSTAQLTAAAAGVGLLVAMVGIIAAILVSTRAARWIGDRSERWASGLRKMIGKPPMRGWGEGLVGFRTRSIKLLRKRWLALTASTALSHLTLYAVLLLALRHVGVAEDELGWVEVLAAFAFIRLVSALPITPGGLGVVELGLTAVLVSAGGPEAQVVAAVLVYRALTYLLPIPIGLAAYARWKSRAGDRLERAENARVPVAKGSA
jgi:putative heme transporter